MITKEYFPSLLKALGFDRDLSGVWTKSFDKGKFSLSADCTTERLIYPEELKVNVGTTTHFSDPENFVVFECVHRLLEKGYHPSHIELEKPVKVGHGASGGRLDIWIKDNYGKSLLIIECKSAGKEFESAWKDTLHNGGQLFSYAHALDNQTPFVALYASDWNGETLIHDYRLVTLQDNEEYLKNLPKETTCFKKAATVKERFQAWAETYQQDFTTRGLFEPDIAPYTIGKTKYAIADLKEVGNSEIQSKYHEFATILRQHNVSGHENAFDKLVNLFLAKIVDENENPEELKFYWKGAAYDDVFSLTDRLQFLYKRGMEEFLKEKVTYIDNNDIEKAFRLFKKDATKRTILDYFRQLKFFTNNDFAFIDVHNEKLFHQNAAVLLKIVRMLQDIRLQTSEQNQFLGDLFEGFLDKGVKQSEGQFFTPTPIVRFLISSLPLETLISESPKPPRVIDYACGAGHFLNEYCHQISPFVRKKHFKKQTKYLKTIERGVFQPYYAAVTGVEKEYRLSKVSKVSASMYGQDDIQIVYADALASHPEIQNGTYSVLVANPPYSVKGFLETLPEADRKRYDLFDAAGDLAKNNSIECFFVERAKQLLAPGGVAAIILPSSILSNAGIYTRMREILLKYFDIVAIAEFGSGTFGKTGTNTATLFLRRKASKPDLAEHYWNRVETWFEGNFSLDSEFEDAHLLAAYCSKIGIVLDTYRTLLNGSPSPALLETEMFKEYRQAFVTSTDAKNIRKKKFNNNYTEADQTDELQEAWLSFLRARESDKLYTFMLAKSNPLPVVLLKTPADSKAIKNFLGYEWSSRKGNEGIKYIGAFIPASDDDDEETLTINKGVSQIKTPLFNPQDLFDPEKANSIIRAAFNGEMPAIPETLSPFISCTPLTDLLDFSRATFDKAFKTTPSVKTEIVSHYPLVKLGNIAEFSSDTVLASKLTPQTYVGVDNLLQNLAGKTDSEFVPKNGNVTQFVVGDILLSNIRPYLKKIWFADNTGGASNDVLVLRVTDSELDARFVYYCLEQNKFFDHVMGAVKGVKMPRGDKNHILRYPIPKPDPATQSKIVAECKDVDANCISSQNKIGNAYMEIANVFQKSDTNRVLPFRLFNKNDFELLIGKRVVEKDLESDGTVPIYSANVFEPLGHFNKLLIKDFSMPSVLWGIDGDWMVNLLPANQPFYPTDHCGVLRVKTDEVNPRYLAYALKKEGEKQRFSRTLRASTERIRALTLNMPPPEEQNRIVAEVEKLEAEIAAAKAVLAAAPARKQEILEKWL